MNYRHEFHAGNFADVMKHVLLLQLMQQLGQKDKPYHYIDTHAGEGVYDLSKSASQKSGEYLNGIHRLINLPNQLTEKAPEQIKHYLSLVQQLRETNGRGAYPGSPWLAMQMLRAQDQASLIEFQPQVYKQLKDNIYSKQIATHERDAYEGLLALIPPAEKRGLIMIDPPYELERKDFPQLVEWIEKSYKKWSTGTFALWYPIKDRSMIDRFEKKMKKTGIRKQLICEICVWPDDTNLQLNGCGLLVINPPWKFAEYADSILQWLAPHLKMTEHANSPVVRWLVAE